MTKIKGIYKGEITIEAAIVTPLVLILVMTLIYMVFYVHDSMILKAYAYGTANEQIEEEYEVFKIRVTEAVNRAPLFLIRPKLTFEKHPDSYEVKIRGVCTKRFWGFEHLLDEIYEPRSITIEKNMSGKSLYISRILIKEVERNS